MAAQFRAFGWKSQIDRAGNVVAFLAEKPRGPYVAVTAHLDTVLAPRAKEDIVIGTDGVTSMAPGFPITDRALPRSSPWHARQSRHRHDIVDRRAEPVLIGNVRGRGRRNPTGMRWPCEIGSGPRGLPLFLSSMAPRPITSPPAASRQPTLRGDVHGSRRVTVGAITVSATRCTRWAGQLRSSRKPG